MVFMLLTGWMVDRYSYLPVFLMFGLIPLLCAGILWTWLGPLVRDSDFPAPAA
jgi:ACS family hexuronate transporter-like MFS transporter